MKYLPKKVEVEEILWGKVREFFWLILHMNKSGRPNYLNEEKDLLVVESADIEGDHGLPLDCNVVSHQLQDSKSQPIPVVYITISMKIIPQVFMHSNQVCKQKEG